MKRSSSMLLSVGLITLTLAAAPSLGIVGGITDLADFSNPASQYYGMNWSYNYISGGTSVAIGYFSLLTASHYSMNLGYTFTVNGDSFRVKSMTMLSPDPGQGTQTPDLRVVHLENLTNPYRPLPGFYDLYTGAFSTATQKNFVMVGTGNTGSTTSAVFYTDTAGTRALRWGTNKFDIMRPDNYLFTDYANVPHSTKVFKMSYGKYPADMSYTPYESGLGTGDSGCGVFVNDGGVWKLAGIGLYRENYQSDPNKFQIFYAASIPTYATRLSTVLQNLHDMLPGDLNNDGRVNLDDFIRLKVDYGKSVTPWTQGDFNGDGLIGYQELLAIQTNLGYDHALAMTPSGSWSAPSGTAALPEPTTLLFLGAGALGLTARRRRRAAAWR